MRSRIATWCCCWLPAKMRWCSQSSCVSVCTVQCQSQSMEIKHTSHWRIESSSNIKKKKKMCPYPQVPKIWKFIIKYNFPNDRWLQLSAHIFFCCCCSTMLRFCVFNVINMSGMRRPATTRIDGNHMVCIYRLSQNSPNSTLAIKNLSCNYHRHLGKNCISLATGNIKMSLFEFVQWSE